MLIVVAVPDLGGLGCSCGSLVQAVFGKDPREYSVMTKEFLKDADGNVKGLITVSVEVTPQGIKQIPGARQGRLAQSERFPSPVPEISSR